MRIVIAVGGTRRPGGLLEYVAKSTGNGHFTGSPRG